MKKLYFLFFTFLITSFSFGQDVAVNGDFESWTGGILDTWTSESGTTITQETTTVAQGTYAANFEVTTTTQGDTDFRQSISVTNGYTYDVSVQIYQVDNGARARIYAGNYQNYSDPDLTGQWQTITYQYVATSTGSIEFGLRFYDTANFSTSSTIIVDDFQVVETAPSCGILLGTETYTCTSNTTGDNNDTVTIDIPYSGVDAGITSVTTSSSGTITGDDPASVTDGTITITGLSEGDAWDITINGGDCDGTNISGTIVADLCDPSCFDLSAGPEMFELVTVQTNSDLDEWTESSGTYSMNGYCGGGCAETVNTWLIFGPLDMTSVTDLNLAFDATESFGTTDLVVAYTSSYTDCPSNSTWTTAQTISTAGSYDVDLSAASGTGVFIGIQYLDDGADGYSSWSLSNVALEALGSCPALGTRPTSNCPALSTTDNQIEGFSMYPNPTDLGYVNISSRNNSKMEVAVYDMLGKQVINETVANKTLDVSELNAGIYIMKFTQEEASTTKKLVIR